jgi:hypothetical protein
MPNPGDIFESYVQSIYQDLLDAQGRNISVSRGATVFDSHGNSYNIDVFYEFDAAGIHHRVAIECKDTRRPVERDEAIAFTGKIHDLPSTIGVFISRSGFQPAAEKYLQGHGVSYYTGRNMPDFRSVLAARISQFSLPDESVIGQPFWTLMQLRGGVTTGVWQGIPSIEYDRPNGSGNPAGSGHSQIIIPLFYSRPHAELFHRLAYNISPEICVRGVEQAALRFLLLNAHDGAFRLAIVMPFMNGDVNTKFTCEEQTAEELAKDYCTYDLSAHFKNS